MVFECWSNIQFVGYGYTSLCIAGFTFGKNWLFLFIKAISLQFSCCIFARFRCPDNGGLIMSWLCSFFLKSLCRLEITSSLKPSELGVFFVEMFNYEFNFFNISRAINTFLFLLESVVVICFFQGIFPFNLSCQVYWNKVIYISLSFWGSLSSIVMSSLHSWH